MVPGIVYLKMFKNGSFLDTTNRVAPAASRQAACPHLAAGCEPGSVGSAAYVYGDGCNVLGHWALAFALHTVR
jgi:hypothetical protein